MDTRKISYFSKRDIAEIQEKLPNIPKEVSKLNDLEDVQTSSPSNGQVLTYNSNKWQNATPTNTWRPVKLNGNQILNNTTSSSALNLKAGVNMKMSNSNGQVTFQSTDEIANNTDIAAFNYADDGSVDITVTSYDNTQLFCVDGDRLYNESVSTGSGRCEVRITSFADKIVSHKVLVSKTKDTEEMYLQIDFDASHTGNYIVYYNSSVNESDDSQDPISGHSFGSDNVFILPSGNYMLLIDFTIIPNIPLSGKYTVLASAKRFTKPE